MVPPFVTVPEAPVMATPEMMLKPAGPVPEIDPELVTELPAPARDTP
jgi:hypothetical protein